MTSTFVMSPTISNIDAVPRIATRRIAAPSRDRVRPRVKGAEADVKRHLPPIGVPTFYCIAVGISPPWSAETDRSERVTLRVTLSGAATSS
jgi:hypothetical protein